MHVSRHSGRLRLSLAASLLIALALQVIWSASPAEAQGFFQQLFGLSPSPQMQSAPRAVAPRQPLSGTPMHFVVPPPRSSSSTSGSIAPEGSGSYTTMCVRMCDGYYFPISHRVPRSRFYRDADMCQMRCGGSEARLFYHSSHGGDMKDAVDLTGRSYARLPIAFQHRKRLVAGCGCKPEPWSVEATARHEGYAIAEGRSIPGSSRGSQGLTVVAGNYPNVSSHQATTSHSGDTGPVESEHSDASSVQAEQQDAAEARLDAAPATSGSGTRNAATARRSNQVSKGPTSRTPARTVAAHRSPAAAFAAAPPRKPTKVAAATTGGSGGAKLLWPGDAPSRVR